MQVRVLSLAPLLGDSYDCLQRKARYGSTKGGHLAMTGGKEKIIAHCAKCHIQAQRAGKGRLRPSMAPGGDAPSPPCAVAAHAPRLCVQSPPCVPVATEYIAAFLACLARLFRGKGMCLA